MKSLFLFTSVALLLSSVDARAEPRQALLMGVWDYRDATFPALPEAGINADLTMMKTKLEALGFTVAVSTNPSLKDAKAAVDAFGTRIKSAPGTSLFYFSGHGSEFEGKNYLIPAGSSIVSNRDLDGEALNADRVLARMEDSGGKVNILFLDCCRNGLAKSAGKGLAPIEARGTFIGYATSSQKVSSATQQGSPYTRILAKHLDTPGISIMDMHTLVTREVREIDPAQVPHQYSGLDSLFFFKPGSSAAALSEAEIDRRARELAKTMAPKPSPVPKPAPQPRPAPRVEANPAVDAEDKMIGKRDTDDSGTQLLTTGVCLKNTGNTALAYQVMGPSGWQTRSLSARSEKVVILTYQGGIRFMQNGRFRRVPVTGYTQPHYCFTDPNLRNIEAQARQHPVEVRTGATGDAVFE